MKYRLCETELVSEHERWILIETCSTGRTREEWGQWAANQAALRRALIKDLDLYE